jgi:hypothetical protein
MVPWTRSYAGRAVADAAPIALRMRAVRRSSISAMSILRCVSAFFAASSCICHGVFIDKFGAIKAPHAVYTTALTDS